MKQLLADYLNIPVEDIENYLFIYDENSNYARNSYYEVKISTEEKGTFYNKNAYLDELLAFIYEKQKK